MIVEDEDGDQFARTQNEEHYTITTPYNYLTHVTPDEGTGAKGTAEKIIQYLKEAEQIDNVLRLLEVTLLVQTQGGKMDQFIILKQKRGEKFCGIFVYYIPMNFLLDT